MVRVQFYECGTVIVEQSTSSHDKFETYKMFRGTIKHCNFHYVREYMKNVKYVFWKT